MSMLATLPRLNQRQDESGELFFFRMTFGARLRCSLGLVLFVKFFVAADAIFVDGLRVVLHLFGGDLLLGSLVGLHLFFQSAGHLSRDLVAFDAALHIIITLQIL